eukprot:Protomagalhaensia_sp_Gyna_25__3729@NODE_334_length_3838_cov_597_592788_g261_i0_p1_GENE_NODE_334_length_3838_cov_597_592788_g261_i0NODE_334_length_3838_cov_597_592788_g261_i0_p1_ORF_typecomplete_len400_score85_16SIMPL/PF04402_14/7_7e13SIMPL/PF04402_14/7_4e11_NODE_334_length_3838_cov_597_592788_g261_i024593658
MFKHLTLCALLFVENSTAFTFFHKSYSPPTPPMPEEAPKSDLSPKNDSRGGVPPPIDIRPPHMPPTGSMRSPHDWTSHDWVPGMFRAAPGPPVSERRITVVGKGKVEGTPNMARLHLTTKARHSDAFEAKESLDATVENLVQSLDSIGVPRKENITHLSLTVDKRTGWKDGEEIFLHFEATQHIEVLLRLTKPCCDEDKACCDENKGAEEPATEQPTTEGESKKDDRKEAAPRLDQVVNAALKAPMSENAEVEISYITPVLENRVALTEKARELAVEDAKASAKQLATSLGMELGLPITVELQPNGMNPVPLVRFSSPAVGEAVADTMANAVGEQKMSFDAGVKVTFDLLAPRKSHSSSTFPMNYHFMEYLPHPHHHHHRQNKTPPNVTDHLPEHTETS